MYLRVGGCFWRLTVGNGGLYVEFRGGSNSVVCFGESGRAGVGVRKQRQVATVSG